MNLGAFLTLGDIVFLITCYPLDCKPLGITEPGFPIAVNHVEDGPFIVLVKQGNMKDILADKGFGGDFRDCKCSVFSENNYVINVRAIKQISILFQ